MLSKLLRHLINVVLPWYDEQKADAEEQRTHEVIKRSVHHRQRYDRLLTTYPIVERRRMPRGQATREDYQRGDKRIGW